MTVISAVFGGLALSGLEQELVPSVQSPAVAIVTDYKGATAAVVDNDVSAPIEKAVRAVEGLTESSTISANGLSLVTVSFTIGTDLSLVEQKLEKALSAVKSSLPPNVSPQIRTGSVDDLPIMQFAVSTPDGAAPNLALRTSVSSSLEKIQGVRSASFLGEVGQELSVTPRAADAQRYGLASIDIAQAITNRGGLISGGKSVSDNKAVPIQIGRNMDSVDAVLDTPIQSRSGDGVIRIRDVADATIQDTERDTIARVDGKSALVLSVEKLPAANTVEVASEVEAEMSRFADDGSLEYSSTFNQAPAIESSVASTALEGVIGLACAILVVFVFLVSVKMTAISAVSIPLSVLLTALAMQAVGYSLNIVTLGALTVAIGRVVDDSIVVVESIERELGVNQDRLSAIVTAVGRVAAAVVSSTLTTVAVFAPLAFIGGATGALFRPFAVTASVALLASLVVSLTIVPVLSYWLLRPRELPDPKADASTALAATSVSNRFRAWTEKKYGPIIQWAINHAPQTLVAAVVVVIGSAFLLPGIATAYLPGVGQTSIHVVAKDDPASTLTSQESNAAMVEERLNAVDGVDSVRTTVGSSGNVLRDASLGGGSGLTSYIVSVEPDVQASATLTEIRTALEELGSSTTFNASLIEDVGFASDLEVSVTALSRADLETAINTISEKISTLEQVSDVANTLAASGNFVDVAVDDSTAVSYGVTPEYVSKVVQAATGKQEVGSAVINDSELPIMVAGTVPVTNTEDVKSILVPTAFGLTAFSELGTTSESSAPLVVQTDSGLLSAKLIVAPAGDDLGGATAAIGDALADLDLPVGAEYSVGGAADEQGDAFTQLFVALLVSVLIVYTIMVATFKSLLQPLLLLVSIPFAAVGAVAAQRVSGEALGVASLVGLLMLVGVVVTNAIVLMDRVNQYRKEGLEMREAVVAGATTRLRPILMTALATVLALSPMALGITGHAGFISRPLAVVVIGGLASSTLLTLIVLPTLLVASAGLRTGVKLPARLSSRRLSPARLAQLEAAEATETVVLMRGNELIEDAGIYAWGAGAGDELQRAVLLNTMTGPSFVLAHEHAGPPSVAHGGMNAATVERIARATAATGTTATPEALAALQLIVWDATGVSTVNDALGRLPAHTISRLHFAVTDLIGKMNRVKAEEIPTITCAASNGKAKHEWVILDSTYTPDIADSPFDAETFDSFATRPYRDDAARLGDRPKITARFADSATFNKPPSEAH